MKLGANTKQFLGDIEIQKIGDITSFALMTPSNFSIMIGLISIFSDNLIIFVIFWKLKYSKYIILYEKYIIK